MAEAVVVGAGIVGATTALYLAREGMKVTVLDRSSGSGLETSFANGGLVTPSTALPWCSPTSLRLLLRWVGREEAPLLLRPSAIPRMGLWGLRFLANSRASKFYHSSKALTAFARESLDELDGLLSQRTVKFDLQRGGLIELFRGEAGVQDRNAYAGFLESLGVTVKRLSTDECVALEPHLQGVSPSIRAALLLPDDAWGDAHRFTRAVEDASRQLGVEYRFNTDVHDVVVNGGQVRAAATAAGPVKADTLVVCAGSPTKHLLGKLRIPVPIEPVKGYSISLRREDIGFLPSRPIVDDVERLGVTPLGDRLRVAGTVEFDGFNKTLRTARVGNLTRSLSRLFPGIRLPEDISAWCGLRPMSADGLPIIDATPVRGLFVNAGHGALGWTLACGSAQRVAQLVTGKQPASMSPFRLSRSFW
jgi:D-amino-acid dehydrogenase